MFIFMCIQNQSHVYVFMTLCLCLYLCLQYICHVSVYKKNMGFGQIVTPGCPS